MMMDWMKAVPAHRDRTGNRRQDSPPAALAASLPRWAKMAGVGAVVLGALLALGVPLSSVVPLLVLASCLGMHLLMGHGQMHGGHTVDPGVRAVRNGPKAG